MASRYKPLPSDSYSDNPNSQSNQLYTTTSVTPEMQFSSFDSLVDTSSPIGIDKLGNFVETSSGRRLNLKGINLDASAKLPTSPPNMTSYKSCKDGLFWDGDHISFVGRPFPLEEAETHFNRIKSWGYNTIRYVITWEAIEHASPGKYDDAYIDYTFKVFKIIEKIGGLYVFIDPHQDVWSRFTGGSGAPLWTLYAAGLNPHKFASTEAAFIQNAYPDPANFPKMVWPTNYTRLATFTMFTMFFSGKMFFPKCVINGMNIQDYLQSHFFDSLKYFLTRLQNEHPELMNSTIIGVETMNEPAPGLYGREDLSVIPKSQQLRVYTSPTPFEAMKLGAGKTCEIDTYEIRITGPTKTGKKWVNEHNDNCWVQDSNWDRHYKFKRDEGWEIGDCVYALHGIWDIDDETLLIPDYFNKDPETGEALNMDTFMNQNFVEYYQRFKKMLRAINTEILSFMQVPVFELPPDLINSNIIDKKTVLCQHYYDGMSLMFKTWNTKYNVDTLGILRGRYLNPVFGIVFGERNIRKCIRGQFYELNQEKIEYLGKRVPMMITETGMPFDMDDKEAYQTGDFSSQIGALDCISYALETNNLSHTYWSYCAINCHKWGDRWNNEDFSFWSLDDCVAGPYNIRHKTETSNSTYNGDTLKNSTNSVNSSQSKMTPNESDSDFTVADTIMLGDRNSKSFTESKELYSDGVRALDAILRPYPVLINGIVKESEFDLKNLTFKLVINTNTTTLKRSPSVIFLPSYHFPRDEIQITVTSGTTTYKYNNFLQVIEWDHETNIGDLEMFVTINDDPSNQLASKNSSLKGSACGLIASISCCAASCTMQ